MKQAVRALLTVGFALHETGVVKAGIATTPTLQNRRKKPAAIVADLAFSRWLCAKPVRTDRAERT
jgi:hypothetical protein